MARTKKKKRSKRGFKLSLAIVAGLLPGVTNVYDGFKEGGLKGAGDTASMVYLGYDPIQGDWRPSMMWMGLYPLALGLIIHKAAGMLGVNRMLANAGIPVVRV